MPDLIPAEEPGGMTWQEVKDFLDHIRTTCMDERTALKLEVRKLRQDNDWLWAALRDTYGDLQQLVPGFSKPYVEAKLRAPDEKGS